MHIANLLNIVCTIFIANVAVLKYGVLAEIQTINQETLDVIVKKTNYVLVHIRSTKDCDAECKGNLQLLQGMQETLSIFDVKVYSMQNSKLLRPYGSKDKQADNKLFFYRFSVPLLYEATELQTEEVLEFVQLHNSIPYSRPLDDQGFEHQTQASTGSTTGDWFILFYSSKCAEYISLWETLAARLAQHKVVGMVDMEKSPITKERFHMELCPSAIYLRAGKYYRYEQPMELSKLVLFAEGWFKNAPSFTIKPLPSFFDNVLERIVSLMKDSQVFKYLMLLPPAIIAVFLVIFASKHLFPADTPNVHKDE